jgi:hypothetical protein
MATPTYKGTGQPAANSGWLSGVGSFGTSAPAYAPAPAAVAPAASTAPAAAASSPSAAPGSAVVVACEPDRIVLVIPRGLIDAQQLAESALQVGAIPSGDAERITLVIPRSLIDQRQ